ncbi:MAG: hypothetical protein JWL88_527 [Parcubacteria group bacterium]|nr:hypothetical protein [Parcubacteria group bacterium]
MTIRRATSVVLLIPLVLLSFPPAQANAAVSNWVQKGVTFYPYSAIDFNSAGFRTNVDHYKSLGANTITLVIPLFQANTGSTDIYAGGNTPSDATLAAAAQYVHSKGMQVMFKIHLDPQTGEWRANINPGNRDAWYANYLAMLKHYGQIAATQNVETICIGTELIDMASGAVNPDNTQRWQNMISQLRQVYNGKLTYGANWGGDRSSGEASYIGFWSSLDYIGISGYYPLSGDGSVVQDKAGWTGWANGEIKPIYDRVQKPVIFTEMGYRSAPDAHAHPYDWWDGGAYDPQEQVNSYEALFEFWDANPYMQGGDIWYGTSDANAGGAGNTDYLIQGKPVEQTIQHWFTMQNAPQATTTPPVTNGPAAAFTVTGAATAQGTNGQPVNLSASVTATGGAAIANVDLEVYDTAGHQVAQNVYSSQSFAAGQSRPYITSWTPTASGTYVLKAGIFDPGWKLVIWNDSVTQVTVGSGTTNGGTTTGSTTSTTTTATTTGSTATTTPPTQTPPPPPPANPIIDLWWPTNGATVSGVQPFKALLENAALNAYTMFWQVDGDALNAMSDSQTDASHKEALVDLTNWNWKGNGPYSLNFIAKDASGKTLAQQASSISVAHY